MPEEVGAMRPSSQGELFTHVFCTSVKIVCSSLEMDFIQFTNLKLYQL